MVVCKFFLQGTCKFDNNCKFEHQINDSTNTNSVSIMRQNPPTNTGNVPDVGALVRSVQTDMLNTEKGGQWLLSSYAPFKEKPAFPGFEDKSFEEIRLGFYESTKNGSVEQYKQQLQGFLQEAVMKIRTLQNPSPDIVNLLKIIYNTPLNPTPLTKSIPFQTGVPNNQSVFSGGSLFSPGNANTSPFNAQTPATAPFTQQAAVSPFNQQAPFNTQTTNSPFNAQAVTNSPFAAVQQQAGAFVNQGNSNSPFAQVQSASPFTQAQNPSPFTPAQSQNSSAFTQAQTQNPSPFTQAQTPNPSPFAQVQAQAQNPPFTQSQTQVQNVSPFVQAQGTSPFSQAQTFSPSPFAQVQSVSPFVQAQGQAQNPSPFASVMQKPTTSPFLQQAAPVLTSQSNSPFASIASTQSNSILSSGQNTVVAALGGQTAAGKDSSIYSNESDLSKDELEAFRSNAFQMGKIPEKPPPAELCF